MGFPHGNFRPTAAAIDAGGAPVRAASYGSLGSCLTSYAGDAMSRAGPTNKAPTSPVLRSADLISAGGPDGGVGGGD